LFAGEGEYFSDSFLGDLSSALDLNYDLPPGYKYFSGKELFL
jgi:hypothetical protein